MTSLLKQYIPKMEGGGSRFGTTFIKLYLTCPYQWAMAWVAPHPDGGQGLTTRYKARPLLAGGSFHAGIERWYASRCINPSTGQLTEDHGRPDVERAEDDINTWVAQNEGQWETPEEREADRTLTIDWLRRYDEFYGPKGVVPEFPDTRVYVDETGPWIEREVTIPLPGDMEFTCRIDLVASHMGFPCVYEHKTSSPSSIQSLCSISHLSAQPSAELLALKVGAHLPFIPAACVMNVLNKKPPMGGKGKTLPFYRERVSRTEADLEKFLHDVTSTLQEIEERLGAYQRLLEDGVPTYQALLTTFPRRGTFTGACHSYNRKCDYWALCANTGREHLTAGAYRARSQVLPQAPIDHHEEYDE
jgi:hypothetical protein